MEPTPALIWNGVSSVSIPAFMKILWDGDFSSPRLRARLSYPHPLDFVFVSRPDGFGTSAIVPEIWTLAALPFEKWRPVELMPHFIQSSADGTTRFEPIKLTPIPGGLLAVTKPDPDDPDLDSFDRILWRFLASERRWYRLGEPLIAATFPSNFDVNVIGYINGLMVYGVDGEPLKAWNEDLQDWVNFLPAVSSSPSNNKFRAIRNTSLGPIITGSFFISGLGLRGGLIFSGGQWTPLPFGGLVQDLDVAASGLLYAAIGSSVWEIDIVAETNLKVGSFKASGVNVNPTSIRIAGGLIAVAGRFNEVVAVQLDETVAAERVAAYIPGDQTWFQIGDGIQTSSSFSEVKIARFNNQLYAWIEKTGTMTGSGATPLKGIARWNGAAWEQAGPQPFNGWESGGRVAASVDD